MTTSLKKRSRKLILIFLLLFVVMFVFRLIYGYGSTNNTTQGNSGFFESIRSSQKNYASAKYKASSNSAPSASQIDQKYEKIAAINTKSTEFDKEEKQTREQIKTYNALIQFEQKSGNNGNRKLNLQIGVPPENFDSLYKSLIKIGKVSAKQITKKDKTNEYKELNAKKASLEKIRNSLIELKTKGGKIDEYMQLENRILDIEQQLQGLGVSLGDFDDENEFCTVQFSMNEGKVIQIRFIHRVKVALEWTIKFFLRLMTSLLFVVIVSYVLLWAIEKAQLIEKSFRNKK